MKSSLAKFLPIIIFGCLILFFFKPFFIEGKLPIPSDTIVGMYHPWRDFYANDYPQGIPFKNFLITDPVRQQYVWRHLATDLIKKGQLPLWNPYNFVGTPLMSNIQSAVFYPLNIIFAVLPFSLGWSILVILQSLLAGLFLYLYLRHLRINQWGSLVGAVTFAFSGFSIAWLEWNTILHVGLWLPLILLSIDKIFISEGKKEQSEFISYINISYKRTAIWCSILIFSLISSLFAGHLQTFFYVLIFSLVYLFFRWWQYGRKFKTFLLFAICYLLFAILTAVQWVPTLQFINLSARSFDQLNWQQSGWFIPWQNLIQFLAPDFFGNPATLNYWGEWNYGEFIGYIGILPLILALIAIFYRHDKKTLFFTGAAVTSLIFALPTFLAKLPFQWQWPLISTSQPTRLLFLTDFSLSILVALGFDWFTKHLNDSNQLRKFIKTILPLGIAFSTLWLVILSGQNWLGVSSLQNLTVAKRNLILPTSLFAVSSLLLILLLLTRKHRKSTTIIYIIVASIVVFDLFRFGWKFTPFTNSEWLFPQTETIKFLQNQPKPFRFMTTDRRIFPPNFSVFYRLEDVAGYDPLYLQGYGELVAAWVRGKPDIAPLSFNRLLTPQDYSSPIADLLNVKYVLSLKDEISPKLKLVFQEGQTRVYENKSVLPRVFLVRQVKWVDTKQQAIEEIFKKDFNPLNTAVLEKPKYLIGDKVNHDTEFENTSSESVKITSYSENKIIISTKTNSDINYLVILNNYYPSWKVKVYSLNNHYTWSNNIYKTDSDFQGVFIPKGENVIEFSANQF